MELLVLLYLALFIHAIATIVDSFILGCNHPSLRYWWWKKDWRDNTLIAHDIFCFVVVVLIPLLYFILR